MPAITKPNQHFNVVTYTATPGSGATVSGVGFQPDLLWTKNRDNVESHYLQDSVRGFSPSTGVTKMLVSNTTAAEANVTGITCTTTSDGFTVADSVPASGEFWFTNRTYVAWNWKAGGAAVTNNDGTITSQVSANPTAGFSIVTYTGTGSIATIGHGLGVAPAMMIIKARNAAQGWLVYHQSIGNTGFVYLDQTAAASYSINGWNNTSPTSSVFTTGVNSYTNQSGQTQVAYCWSEIAGFSKFGSYTGNGSTNGPFVYTGFRPRFIMIKDANNALGPWVMYDTSRSTYNAMVNTIRANASSAEDTYSASDGYNIDALSNGFKVYSTWNGINNSGDTTIYMAFAEAPFKYSSAR
jgi:hypothetical protein